jgi:tetratricopeptide (TPR) repeat protein
MIRSMYLGCALMLVASGCSRDPQRTAATFVASGDGYVARHEFKEAAIEYRNALDQTPRDVEIELKLAHAYEQAKDYERAYRSYVRAAELDVHRTDAHRWLAEFLLQNGRFEDAQRHASAMLEDNASDVHALILLASASAALRDRAAALTWVQQALAVDPASATAHTMLGTLRLTGGDRNRARDAFVKATQLAPTSAEPWIALAQFHIAVGELKPAEHALTRALAVASDQAAVHRLLGMFYVGAGRAREAEPHLKAFAEANVHGRVLLADYDAAMGRPDEALALLQGLVADPTADKATVRLAHLRTAAVLHAKGEHARAHAELTPLLTDEEIAADAHALKAQLIMREAGDLADASMHAREAVTRRPSDPSLQYVQGTIHLARGELSEAETSLRRAGDLSPGSPQIELQLARLAVAKRDYRSAIDRTNRVVAAAPTIDAVALLAEATRLSGDIPKARQIIRVALKQQPTADRLYLELGAIELAAGQPDAARAAFERCLAAGVDVVRARRGLVAADLAAKRTADADARIKRWTTESPTAPDVPLLAAAVHVAERSWGSALADYERAAQASPPSAGTYTAIGMLKAERGDHKGAQEAYERAIQLDPRAGVAANNLAWIYAGLGRGDDALTLAKTAHQTLGDGPADDTLGWIYYLQNLPDLAVPLFEKVAEANPRNALYRYHLGAALIKAKRADRGRLELERALALSTTFDGAADARRLLTAQ